MTPRALYTPMDYANANGMTLAHDAFGDPSDPAAILIMGLGTQMIVWDEGFCRLLADRGFHVIRFDNRDVGLSTWMTTAGVPDLSTLSSSKLPYTLEDMAMDVLGLMDALQIEDGHLIGASMGGMIAMEAAAACPDRVRSLAVVMSSTGNPELPPPTEEAMDILMTPFPTDRFGYVDSFVRAYRVLSGNSCPIDPRLSRKWAEESFRRGLCPEGVARQFAAIAAAGDRRARLGQIVAPALVIHGDEDPLLRTACGEDIARSIRGARLEIVTGMGHCLPEDLWPQIVDLIDSHCG
ncbi:MAG: alpha/beta hydrolase [Desulfobacterales bacterium]